MNSGNKLWMDYRDKISVGSTPPCNTLIIEADHIFLHHNALEVTIDLSDTVLDKYDKIIINGVTFTRK